MQSIVILNTLFIVFLVLTILFFVTSVLLFFLFDIRNIYMVRSGRAEAKTVKEMEEINASTGRLRVGGKTQTGGLKKVRKRKNVIQLPEEQAAQPTESYSQPEQYAESYQQQPAQYEQEYETTERLDDAGETAILNAPMFDDAAETSVLMPEAETSVLSQPAAGAQPQQDVTIYFDVIKKIIVCDTDEVIR